MTEFAWSVDFGGKLAEALRLDRPIQGIVIEADCENHDVRATVKFHLTTEDSDRIFKCIAAEKKAKTE